MKLSLVSTVYNEALRLSQTIEDLRNQTLQPSEIIITDAGSTDGTYEALLHWKKNSIIPITIIQMHRCNVAEGRNIAIREASYDIIVSTDFGCRFTSQWLESLASPFQNKNVKVVGGTYSVIESEIKSEAAKANFIICDGYYVKPYEGFIPSSRSIAYYKYVWESVGGYPEWLTLAADDLVFGMILLKQGHKIEYVDTPNVYWGRHTTTKAYVKEAFRYGLGDGEARVNLRQFISKGAETIIRYVLFLYVVGCLMTTIKLTPLTLLPLILTIPAFRSYYWAFKNWIKHKSKKYSFSTLLYTIPLIERSRMSYLKGYIKGYWFSTAVVKEQSAILHTKLK